MPKLGRVSRQRLHATLQEAFADYAVDMTSLTEERLRIRCAKNNVDWEISVGAFNGDRMVGFTLIGVDSWRGGLGAFDAATGIVPAFRGRGLARTMFEHALPELQDRGVDTFVLEVLVDNEPAIRAYRKTGFEISRTLKCYGLDLADLASDAARVEPFPVRPIERLIVGTLESAVDWLPSWENSFRAIERIPDDLVCLGAFDGLECVGALAYSPAMNWILTLVVRSTHRRLGVGSALLMHLGKALAGRIDLVKLLNVDAVDQGMTGFLEASRFQLLVDQYEMVRPMGSSRVSQGR